MQDLILLPWHSGKAGESIAFFISKGLNNILASAQEEGPDQAANKWSYYLRKLLKDKPQALIGF